MNPEMLDKIRTGQGFIAALDQSGGSTPRALRAYGVDDAAWTDEATMFDLVHAMRTRIITSPAFTGARILAAILFEQTMDRRIEGLGAAEYLWERKRVVPFLKIDHGLEPERDGARTMRPIPDLDGLLDRARSHGVFGTKMRSVVLTADERGIASVVEQQLDVARRVLAADLVPIIEPEVDIHSPEKASAEKVLGATLAAHLDRLDDDQEVMLKLTLPDEPGALRGLVTHPRVLRVAALSGGYSRAEATAKLRLNQGVIASFSRALTEGLDVHMDDEEFDAALDASIASIYDASRT